ncbi:Mitochondrial proton/calcium exchanger protein [Vanrija pseudolonga]|uniref:Mitochondrial proton/calcium exchanger protein n=1 Tax=Vanrija pseudolonga TaxID=143232 RepID=A0AAF0YG87_9TREE|nr:Mitochondrial proton/calcium exchanger protein [Vanrija pseudolonga]
MFTSTTRATSTTTAAAAAAARGARIARRSNARTLASTSRSRSLVSPATPTQVALRAIGAPAAVAVGLRHVPSFLPVRLYSTETRTTTTTTTPPLPSPAPAPSEKDAAAAVPVPPPGAPAPPVPAASEKPTEVAAAAAEKEKEVAKKDKKPTGPWHSRAWAVVKKELAHYWAGTKLLGQEIKISSKLQYKVLQGGSLTRRERRQLRRTTTDILRLVPFSVFVIIPFMEFLLPVALKLFPNMLPSTFEGQLAKDEKERKLLRVRLEMAKFLQETVRDTGLQADGVVHSDEFKEFFRKVRSTGETPSDEDVIKVAKLFNSDITLDNLSRPQLVSMCKYMNINAFGTDNFLKHQIRSRLEKIRVDDMMIHAEGVDSLTTKELQHACQSRGIRFQGMSPARLREELEQWINLHYTNKISGVLLILSRAFNFDNKGDDVMSSLVTTLSSLPESLVSEAELHVSGDKATYKERLEVLQQQQELIEDEAEQEQEELEARKKEKEAKEAKEAEEAAAKEEEAKAAAAAAAAAAEPAATPAEAATVTATASATPEASVTAEAPAAEAAAEPAAAAAEPVAAEEDDAKMTKEQLGELAEALSILTAKSSIIKERDELQALFEDNLLSEAESKERPEEHDSKSVALSKRVRSMIKKVDAELEKYDERVGASLNLINTNHKGQISLADLKSALRVIKHAPPEDVIEGLGKKLDVDQDGFVDLDHVLELTQDDGLGIVIDDAASDLVNKGKDIRHSTDVKEVKELKPKREDIISE